MHNHADGTDDGGFARKNTVSGERRHIAARRADSTDHGDNGLRFGNPAERLVKPFAAIGGAAGAVDIDDQRLGGGILDNPVKGLLPAVILDDDFCDIEAGHMIRDLVLCHLAKNPDADNDQQQDCQKAPKRQAPL